MVEINREMFEATVDLMQLVGKTIAEKAQIILRLVAKVLMNKSFHVKTSHKTETNDDEGDIGPIRTEIRERLAPIAIEKCGEQFHKTFLWMPYGAALLSLAASQLEVAGAAAASGTLMAHRSRVRRKSADMMLEDAMGVFSDKNESKAAKKARMVIEELKLLESRIKPFSKLAAVEVVRVRTERALNDMLMKKDPILKLAIEAHASAKGQRANNTLRILEKSGRRRRKQAKRMSTTEFSELEDPDVPNPKEERYFMLPVDLDDLLETMITNQAGSRPSVSVLPPPAIVSVYKPDPPESKALPPGALTIPRQDTTLCLSEYTSGASETVMPFVGKHFGAHGRDFEKKRQEGSSGVLTTVSMPEFVAAYRKHLATKAPSESTFLKRERRKWPRPQSVGKRV